MVRPSPKLRHNLPCGTLWHRDSALATCPQGPTKEAGGSSKITCQGGLRPGRAVGEGCCRKSFLWLRWSCPPPPPPCENSPCLVDGGRRGRPRGVGGLLMYAPVRTSWFSLSCILWCRARYFVFGFRLTVVSWCLPAWLDPFAREAAMGGGPKCGGGPLKYPLAPTTGARMACTQSLACQSFLPPVGRESAVLVGAELGHHRHLGRFAVSVGNPTWHQWVCFSCALGPVMVHCCPATHFHPLLSFGGGDSGTT